MPNVSLIRRSMLRRPTVAAAGAFTPADLSPSLWIEPRAGSVFQSNAGSTAAASNGDPVGYIADLSGNGFHLTSVADDTTRPTVQNVGVLPYLSFDGSNDMLRRVANLGIYSGGAFSVFIAARGSPGAINNYLLTEGNSGSTSQLLGVFKSGAATASTWNELYRDNAGANMSSATIAVASAWDGTDNVVGLTEDGSGNSSGYLDTTTAADTGTYTRGTATFNQLALGALLRTTPSGWFAGWVYGLVVVSRVITATERQNLITYLGNLMGRSL
jgi:hypothetical protein